jgi:hypothetical protein
MCRQSDILPFGRGLSRNSPKLRRFSDVCVGGISQSHRFKPKLGREYFGVFVELFTLRKTGVAVIIVISALLFSLIFFNVFIQFRGLSVISRADFQFALNY